MNDNSEMTIDFEKIVEAKAGKGRVPGFLIRLLKKAVHEDLINDYLSKGYTGVEFCRGCLDYLDIKVEVFGLENLDGMPEGTRFTFASNHPLGGIDGVTLGAVLGEKYDGKIKYLVNDVLMHLKGLAPLCVPINKFGGQARELPALLNEAFASDLHIITFPAGKCSRKIDGRIQDVEWGKSFISKSVSNGRYIVPVHFIGENSKRFYRVATICKKLGIKFNLAMMMLPDEMYRGRGKTFKLIFGKPIPPSTFDRSRTPIEWAQWVREKAYDL